MSRGDWRSKLTLGLAVALACAWAGLIVLRAFPVPRLEYEPEQYSTEDHREQARNETDTRAQIWMANAAWWQFGVGVAGLLGLGATVIFAGLAWREAKRGADASLEQAKIAREHMERMETPFLRAVPTEPRKADYSKGETGFDWLEETIIRFENCGRSYAVITHCTIKISPVWEISEHGFFKPQTHRGRFVGRGAVVPAGGLSQHFHPDPPRESNVKERLAGEGGYVHGLVRFEDPLGKRWVMGFAVLYVPFRGEYFVPVHADDEYANYHQQEEGFP